MLVCESEENRRRLAWLVPGYILLAWFFCVVFQPIGKDYLREGVNKKLDALGDMSPKL